MVMAIKEGGWVTGAKLEDLHLLWELRVDQEGCVRGEQPRWWRRRLLVQVPLRQWFKSAESWEGLVCHRGPRNWRSWCYRCIEPGVDTFLASFLGRGYHCIHFWSTSTSLQWYRCGLPRSWGRSPTPFWKSSKVPRKRTVEVGQVQGIHLPSLHEGRGCLVSPRTPIRHARSDPRLLRVPFRTLCDEGRLESLNVWLHILSLPYLSVLSLI